MIHKCTQDEPETGGSSDNIVGAFGLMRVLKICTGTWENASRDQRELGVCRELGMEPIVLAKGKAGDRGREDTVNGFQVLRFTTRPYKRIPVSVNRVISIFQWAKYASTLNADIISGHDIEGWTIGWLSKFYNRKNKPLFVYDSHEFELGRNAKRNKIQLAVIKFWEKKVIRDSAFTVVVNDSIADELMNIYKLKERPVVVRNIPNKWDIDSAVCAKTRKELENMFGGGYILIYHGAICRNRGIEQLLAAITDLDDVKLLLLGDPESEGYMDSLRKQYLDAMGRNVAIMSAVSHKELWKYIGAADLCVAPIIPKCRSYYFALPNKLFEAIQAGTPLLVSNLPEMRQIVKSYRIGECVNAEDIEALKKQIVEMKNRGKKPFITGLIRAKDELIWEYEKNVLQQAYSAFVR